MAQLIPIFLKEIAQEAQITRKMLALIPEDKYNWKPHEKSMSLIQLATHIAEIPAWAAMAIETDGVDFAAQPYEPTVIHNNKELLELLEKSIHKAETVLRRTPEEALEGSWVLRSGDHIHSAFTKEETIRHSLNQTTHHRAQLGVYLRLLNIPIPGSYGPSADNPDF